MGNDPSKAGRGGASEADDNDGPIRIGGGRGGGGGAGAGAGAGAPAAAVSRSHSFTTLDGHSPYIPDAVARSSAASPTPQQQQQQGPQLSFDEDRRTDLHYSSLDESSSTPSTPSSSNSTNSSNDGPISIGGGRRSATNDIVQINRTTNEQDMEAAALHPEVEAILNLAQVRLASTITTIFFLTHGAAPAHSRSCDAGC